MTDVFIERRFELDETAEVIVRFMRPVPDVVDFRCNYETQWPDRRHSFHACGVDEIQALILALKSVHAELRYSNEGREGRLKWLGNDDLGLPDPHTPESHTRGRGL